MDKELKVNILYKYVVIVVDLVGNEFSRSDVLDVIIKVEDFIYEKWDVRKVYIKGDRVVYERKVYKVV